jgi:hypothetical protein
MLIVSARSVLVLDVLPIVGQYTCQIHASTHLPVMG